MSHRPPARLLALEYLTFNGLPPDEFVRLAASAGYTAVGLRVHPADPADVPHDLGPGTPARRRTRQALDLYGLQVLDVEVFPIGATTSLSQVRVVLEAATFFGASYLNVTGNDPDSARFEQTLHMVAQAASEVGVMPLVEPMGWKCLNSVEEAVRLASSVPNLGVQVDSLHFARLGATVDTIASIPHGRAPYIQLSDAPMAPPSQDPSDWQQEGRTDRMLPGHGELPLRAMLAALSPGCPVAVETPSAAARRLMSDEEWVRRTFDSTCDLLKSSSGDGVTEPGCP